MAEQTLATRSNNPGNLKDFNTGKFRTFNTPEEGYAALLNDLELKVSGKSSTGLNADSTLYDFAKTYAPQNENDSAQYAANLANHLKVRPDTKIGELKARMGEFAQAIAKNEGYAGTETVDTTKELGTAQDYTSFMNQPQKSIWEKGARNLADVGIGIAKGAISTGKGLAELGEKGVAGAISVLPYGEDINKFLDIGQGKTVAEEKIPEAVTTPENVAQKVGKGAEQIGEFLLPMGAVSKGEKAVEASATTLKAAQSSKLAKSFIDTAGLAEKMGLNALASGLTSLAQTGGDIKEASKTAGTFGVTSGILGTIGKGLQAMKIPEKMYSTIFKETWKDTYSELMNAGVKIDESLAKKAVDKGLRGSVQNMAQQVVKIIKNSEADVQTIVKNVTQPIKITSPKSYIQVLKDVAEDYKGVSFNKITQQANSLAKKLTTGKGTLSAEDTLNMRRFLDGLRIRASYEPYQTAKRSIGQQNLKTLTDDLRGKLNSITVRDLSGTVTKMGDIMKDYSFGMDAMESLAKAANREKSKEALGFIDNILLGGGLLTGEPLTGIALDIGKRTIGSPSFKTAVGQTIQEGLPYPVSALGTAGLSKVIKSPFQTSQNKGKQ